MSAILFVFTLGVATLALRSAKKKWPAVVDSNGVKLFNGKHYAWSEVNEVEHLTTNVNRTVAHKYIFHMDKGAWELPYQRLVEPQLVVDFIAAHLPGKM